MQELVNKIHEGLMNNISVCLIGCTGSGKSYFIVNKFIPKFKSCYNFKYFENIDKIDLSIISKDDVVIIDEVETIFDKDFLENSHPEENPYYSEAYILRVNKRFDVLSKIKNVCIYIITRNQDKEIDYLLSRFNRSDWDGREILTIRI